MFLCSGARKTHPPSIDKLTRPAHETVETTTTVQSGQIGDDGEPYTTITTTTTTDSFAKQAAEGQDGQANDSENAVENLELHEKESKTSIRDDKPRASAEGGLGVRSGIMRMLETLTHKESTTTTTIREQTDGLTVDSVEATSYVSFGIQSSDPSAPPSSTPSSSPYPNTINARFVKEQSEQQNVDGLKHALSASIEKSAEPESGKLCKFVISYLVLAPDRSQGV